MTNQKRIEAFHILSIILTSFSMIFLTLAFCLSFDAAEGYLTRGLFTDAFMVFLGIQIIVPFVCALAIPSGKVATTDNDLDRRAIPTAIVGVVLVLISMLGIILNDSHTADLTLIIASGSCCFGIYLLIMSVRGGYKFSLAKLICLYLSVLLPFGIHLGNNSNYLRHINSIENILTSIFSVSFLLYILYEAKRLYKGVHSRMHLLAMMLTFSTGLSFSAPYIVASIFGLTNDMIKMHEALIILFISIYVIIEQKRFVHEYELVSKCELEAKQNEEPNVEKLSEPEQKIAEPVEEAKEIE